MGKPWLLRINGDKSRQWIRDSVKSEKIGLFRLQRVPLKFSGKTDFSLEMVHRGLLAAVLRNVAFATGFACVRASGMKRTEEMKQQRRRTEDDFKPHRQESRLLMSNSNYLYQSGVSFTGGLAGTLLSSPFAYARNVQYAFDQKSGGRCPTIMSCLTELGELGRERKFRELAHRLRIGWGAVRVGVGIALTEFVYNKCKYEWLG